MRTEIRGDFATLFPGSNTGTSGEPLTTRIRLDACTRSSNVVQRGEPLDYLKSVLAQPSYHFYRCLGNRHVNCPSHRYALRINVVTVIVPVVLPRDDGSTKTV